jgi:hypothetical protein
MPILLHGVILDSKSNHALLVAKVECWLFDCGTHLCDLSARIMFHIIFVHGHDPLRRQSVAVGIRFCGNDETCYTYISFSNEPFSFFDTTRTL